MLGLLLVLVIGIFAFTVRVNTDEVGIVLRFGEYVRQLQPGPDGLPMEIYAFSNDTSWANYEGLQADIFDHIMATVPEFDLRVFQKPSGRDLESLKVGPEA